MKVTSKKKMARAAGQGRRVRGKARSDAKSAGTRSSGRRREAAAGAASEKGEPAERRRGARRRSVAEVIERPALAARPGAGSGPAGAVSAYEPETRGTPPPLPTPIATFSI
jgi:hypothetical protein